MAVSRIHHILQKDKGAAYSLILLCRHTFSSLRLLLSTFLPAGTVPDSSSGRTKSRHCLRPAQMCQQDVDLAGIPVCDIHRSLKLPHSQLWLRQYLFNSHNSLSMLSCNAYTLYLHSYIHLIYRMSLSPEHHRPC